MVDPQQRLLLEAGAELIGGGGGGLSEAGVFVGISTPDYADLKKVRWGGGGAQLSVPGGRLLGLHAGATHCHP